MANNIWILFFALGCSLCVASPVLDIQTTEVIPQQPSTVPVKETPVEPVSAEPPKVQEPVIVEQLQQPQQPQPPQQLPPQQDEPQKQPTRDARHLDNDNKIWTMTSREEALLQKLNGKCAQHDMSSCVMLKIVSYMNRLLKKSNIEVSEGIEITKSSSEMRYDDEIYERPRADTDEATAVTQLMTDKLWHFVRTRALRWNVMPEADIVLSTAPDKEGNFNLGLSLSPSKEIEKESGRQKNKNQMGMVMAAAGMKAGLLGALAFKGLVLLVGKALLISKIALLLATIIGLKKLFSQQKHVTYEVVAHPHHSHSHVSDHGGGGGGGGGGHDSYSSGWGRSINVAPAGAVPEVDPHAQAYRAYQPTQ